MKHGNIIGAFVLFALISVPLSASGADSKASKPSSQSASSEKKSSPSSDCANIKAGTVDKNAETAAQKDCQSSKDLGAGMGTSSGTGAGKMPSGSGPR